MKYLFKRPQAVLGLVLLLVTGASLLATTRLGSNYAALLHARGEPASLEELNDWYKPVPEADNAAPLFLAAIEKHRMLPPPREVPATSNGDAQLLQDREPVREPLPIIGEGKLPERLADFPPALRPRLVEYLDANQESLRLTLEGTTKAGLRFPVDMRAGLAVELEHLTGIRTLARLLSLHVVRLLMEQQCPAATEALIAQLRLSALMQQEPVLISHLVHVALGELAVERIRYTLQNMDISEVELGRLQQALNEFPDPLKSLKRAIIGERTMALSYMERMALPLEIVQSTSTPQKLDAWARALAGRALGLTKVNEVVMARAYNILFEGIDTPMHTAASEAAFDQKLEKASEQSVLAAILIPAMSRVIDAPLRLEAGLDMAKAAVAIERYRLAAGKLPSSLEDLVPTYFNEVPHDVFTDNPIQYRPQKGQAYLLYSWGQDREDDGGTALNEQGRRDSRLADVVFRVRLEPEQEKEQEAGRA